MARKDPTIMVYLTPELRRQLDAEKKHSGMTLRGIIAAALKAWFQRKAA